MKQVHLQQQHHSTNKVANIRPFETTRTGNNMVYCCSHEYVVTPTQAATSPILLYCM